MRGLRARLFVVQYFAWICVVFMLGVLYVRWASSWGLALYLTVGPEWLVWTILCLVGLGVLRRYARRRNEIRRLAKLYLYTESEPRSLGQTVEQLCRQRGLPLPWIYIFPRDSSEGRNASMLDEIQRRDILSLSEVIVQDFPERESRAVVAHELRHSDTIETKMLVAHMTLFRLFSRLWLCCGAIYLALGLGQRPFFGFVLDCLCGFGLLALTFLVGLLLWLSMYRANEFLVDLRSCFDTGDPEALVLALGRLESKSASDKLRSRHRGIFNRFMESIEDMPSTHPMFARRIAALERIFGPLAKDSAPTYAGPARRRRRPDFPAEVV
jgi:Zn-dependent protease with chaperone function